MPHSISAGSPESSQLPGNEDATVLRVLSDGTLVLRLGGEELEAELFGATLLRPLPDKYFQLLQERLPRLGRPLRCLRRGKSKQGRLLVTLWFRAWQDKSGDVWINLVPFLHKEGAVREELASGKE